jgi:hypothetical protein
VARLYICWCLSIHAAVVLASTPPPSIAAVWIAVAEPPRLQSPPLARSRSLGVGPYRFDHN